MGSPGRAFPYDTADDDEVDLSQRYDVLEKIGEGTYGKVYKAMCLKTHQLVAIKKIRTDEDGVPATALREITLLKDVEGHANVVKLHEVFSRGSNLHLVFECLDMDLRGYLRSYGPLRDVMLRTAALQLVGGLEFCHGRRILHRDLKPQNVLVDLATMRLVLADFGLARAYHVPLKVYTHEVVTLWYRAPEILLGQVRYGPRVDIWSLGCIIPEMATGQALFPGDSEIDTIFKIFRTLGTPDDEVWPGVSTLRDWKQSAPKWKDTDFAEVRRLSGSCFGDVGVSLLRQCLKYRAENRVDAKALKAHPFFEGAERSLHTV